MEIQQDIFPKSALELYCKRPLFSLQEMSILRIATILCNTRPLLTLIMRCKLQRDVDCLLYARRGAEWAAVQAMANEMVFKICNCIKICERIMEYFWPVSCRIMLWKFLYAPSIFNQFLQHFYWTDQGRVDNGRTAKYIIENQNISLRKRFVLACKVCLKDEIKEMWQTMSNGDKIYFCTKNREKFRPLLRFWVDQMVEESNEVCRHFIIGACNSALDNGLLEALKYLFKISPEDARKQMAYKYTRRFFLKIQNFSYVQADMLDIGYFLFFEMDDEHRYLMSSSSTLNLLLLFHFSEREHFHNVLEENIRSPSWGAVALVIKMIFYNYHLEIIKDDDYRKIFAHFWRALPASLKDEVRCTFGGVRILSLLIRDNFPFLLRKGAFEKIAELTLVDSKPSTSVTPFGFHQDKWKFLHFLIEEEIVTIPALRKYKDDMMRELKIRQSNKAAWNRVFRFVQKVVDNNRRQKQ